VVSFTGSTHVGRIVNQAAAPGFKKVHLEMGGKNVIMIMGRRQPRARGRWVLWGGSARRAAVHGASRVVVHEKVYKTFVDQFVARAKSLRVGDGCKTRRRWALDQRVAAETVMSYVKIGREEGAQSPAAGTGSTGSVLRRASFTSRTIFTTSDRDAHRAR
jgi:acyl-CoA reductase-like NAD-dependent aldehyde dehydrogenase